ncbi:hypothetical protein ACSNOI_27050 [Actinomadura kijaniata]|uniref:hypothetical protein n=1 Tax=Actinomadura kijaniata TaxID=46161 RepID=UPI003F1E3946
MAISEREQRLRDEARTEILEAIKRTAKRIGDSSQVHAQELEQLANAYAALTGGVAAELVNDQLF